MLSFDSKASLCGHELTTPMQVQATGYIKDKDNQRTEDVKEILRVEKQVVTEAEFKRSKDAKKNLRLEKQVVTQDETESDEEL